MGRPTRMRVTPIPDTPLSLAVVHDVRSVGAVQFRALYIGLAVFGTWVLILSVLVLAVEFATPGRLHWAWPDGRHPQKYRVLVRVLGGFALLLTVQAALAWWFPLHPSSLLVPVQALALGLVALSKGTESAPHASAPLWRDPKALGWGILAGATLLLVWLHRSPGWHLVLLPLQLAVVFWGYKQVADLRVSYGPKAYSREPVRRLYVVSGALMLAVVGVLPAFLLYQEAFAEQLDRLLMHQEVEIVEELRSRADRLRAVNRQAGLPEAFDRLAIADATGLAFRGFFGAQLGGEVPGEKSCWGRRARLYSGLDRLLDGLPRYATDVSVEMGSLTRPAADAYDWNCAGNRIELSAGDDVLRAELPAGLWLPTEWTALVLIVAVGGLVWGAGWLGRRVFLLDLDYAEPSTLEQHLPAAGNSLIVVCTRSMDRDRLREVLSRHEIRYVDLLELMGDDEGQNLQALREATRGSDAICLDHFDQQLGQEAWAVPLLAHLERLVHVDRRAVVLLTSREPSALFRQPAERTEEKTEEVHRWIRLVGQFVKVRVADFATEEAQHSRPSENEVPDDLRAVLEYEAGDHPFLVRIAERIGERLKQKEGQARELTPEGLVDQVREEADSYYHALWSILEREEKLVVAQLAAGVVVNPKCERAVRRLLQREILVLRPELSLMNESFARFVREEISPATVASWERDEPVSAWQRLRFPILLAVAAVAAFLFVTQRTTFDTVIAILSTAAVGATAAIKLVNVTRSSDGLS